MLTANYRLIRTRRKTIALVIERDGALTVRAPLRASKRAIEEVITQKADWIEHSRQKVLSLPPAPPAPRFHPGEQFWYLGKTYPLEVKRGLPQALTLDGHFIMDERALPQARQVFVAWYRLAAAHVLPGRVAWYAARCGFTFSKVKITSARTRWGSCSTRGVLSFPWRLVMAPMEVIDYVVLHELVHTVAHNHSKAFWNRLALLSPGYKTQVEWLKVNGSLLVV